MISEGRSIEHARKMIKDALRLMAEYKLEQGEPLPRPRARVRDKKAVHIETIRLQIGVRLADAS